MKALPRVFLGLLMGIVGCGESSTNPLSQNPTFPTLDQAVLNTFCIRGTASVPAIRAGSLSDLDCPTLGTIVGVTDDGFFETWRVRVSNPTDVTFGVNSTFDNFLDLFQVDLANPNLSSLLHFDNDSGGGTDALLTFTLQADTEYWIVVSGLGTADVGTYTITIG